MVGCLTSVYKLVILKYNAKTLSQTCMPQQSSSCSALHDCCMYVKILALLFQCMHPGNATGALCMCVCV